MNIIRTGLNQKHLQNMLPVVLKEFYLLAQSYLEKPLFPERVFWKMKEIDQIMEVFGRVLSIR